MCKKINDVCVLHALGSCVGRQNCLSRWLTVTRVLLVGECVKKNDACKVLHALGHVLVGKIAYHDG